MKTYRWKAGVSDGKRGDGESVGTVRANSEAEARRLITGWVQQDGARKGRAWTPTNIELG